jgi:hypothetical protein
VFFFKIYHLSTSLSTRVSDPLWFNADPDPACFLIADPDPGVNLIVTF